MLIDKTKQAAKEFGAHASFGGGVAANARLRQNIVATADLPVLIPPPRCASTTAP